MFLKYSFTSVQWVPGVKCLGHEADNVLPFHLVLRLGTYRYLHSLGTSSWCDTLLSTEPTLTWFTFINMYTFFLNIYLRWSCYRVHTHCFKSDNFEEVEYVT